MRYLIKDLENKVITQNLYSNCDNCLSKCIELNGSIKKHCENQKLDCRFGYYTFKNCTVFICSTSKEVLKSKRILKNQAVAFQSMLEYMLKVQEEESNKAKDQTKRLLHNIKEINALNIQEFYYNFPQMDEQKNTKRQYDLIQNTFKRNPLECAKLLLRLLKNNIAMKTEFRVYTTLQGSNPKIKFQKHNVKRVLLNVMHPFFSDFTDEDVYINLEESSLKAYLDYDTFSNSVFLLIENAKKYVAPESNLDITFDVNNDDLYIKFDMISFKIYNDEVDRLCEDGFSGRIASKFNLAGSGIGMYRAKKLLNLNKSELIIKNNTNIEENIVVNGFNYERNQFTIRINNFRFQHR